MAGYELSAVTFCVRNVRMQGRSWRNKEINHAEVSAAAERCSELQIPALAAEMTLYEFQLKEPLDEQAEVAFCIFL